MEVGNYGVAKARGAECCGEASKNVEEGGM
jgi:hypothetical protein